MKANFAWIQFCEPAYVYSQHIAELWNTLSSFAYCLCAIFLYRLTNKFRSEYPTSFTPGVVWRYRFCAFSWFMLGLGSAVFHATQSVWGELWDEIGMLSATLSINFCLYDLHPVTTSKRANWFYAFVTLFSVFIVVVYVQLMHHPFFAACFMVTALIPLGISLTLPMDMNKKNLKLYAEVNARESRAATVARELAMKQMKSVGITGSLTRATSVTLGVIVAFSGYAIWHIDQYCVKHKWQPTIPGRPYEFDWYYWSHPLWHVLTSAAAFLFFDVMCKVRIETYYSPLLRRAGTGSFVPMFSVATSLKRMIGWKTI